jgi:NAD(P)-dependent dehydrogenase (short-subunit alcohol dehydrogenase family)
VAWTPDRLPHLGGSTFVITGANGGLGFETALSLAARDRILEQHPDAIIEVQALDLASLASVRTAATEILARHDSIDGLVCNAAAMGIGHKRSTDGYDVQFATNHLGHFELTRLLWSALAAGSGGRVVTITSFARHLRGRFDPDDPPIADKDRRWWAYGQTKMMNLRFALELDHRARAAGVAVEAIAAHPGLSHTRRNTTRPARPPRTATQRLVRWWISRFGMESHRGAHSQVRAAADPNARGGALYGPRFMTTGASTRRFLMPWTRRSKRLAELWEVSERMTGTKFEI